MRRMPNSSIPSIPHRWLIEIESPHDLELTDSLLRDIILRYFPRWGKDTRCSVVAKTSDPNVVAAMGLRADD